MARSKKLTTPPVTTGGCAPIKAIMTALQADSPITARFLVEEAVQAIYGKQVPWEPDRDLTNEIDMMLALMKGLNPIDPIEALYTAQILVSHLLGMRRLSENGNEDQKLGLHLLRFANETIVLLEKKKKGQTSQHISVTYNYALPCQSSTNLNIGGANADTRD
jgi:hypothetical protein